MKPKRAISPLLAGCMAVSMVPASAVTAFAETVGSTPALAVLAANPESNVHWSFNASTGVLSITGTGAMADYVVPDDGVKATEDNRPWALYADQIKEVRIAEGITRIGDSAFRCLTKLTTVNIPASVTSLGNYIFRCDKELINVTWADGFVAHEVTDKDSDTATYTGTYVPVSMFDFCEKLGQGKELTEWLPKSFTGVSCAAFRRTQFTINFDNWNNLTYIGARAFESMPNLTSFALTNRIQIGLRGGASNAFSNSGLKTASINATKIDLSVFNGCQFEELNVSGATVHMAGYGYNGNTTLKRVNIEAQEYTSESGSFRNVKNLKTVTLKANNAALDSRAFVECPKLESIDLTGCNSVTYQNGGLTTGTAALGDGLNPNVKIYVADDNANPRTHNSGLEANKGIVFVTNGGTVDLTKTGFVSVTKAGYTAEWYTNKDFSENSKVDTTTIVPTAGGTYYAKWTQNDNSAVLSTDMESKWYTIGEEQNVSFTTHVMGTVAGTNTKVRPVITNEPFNSSWKTADGSAITDIELKNDSTYNFKVTFKKAGKYSFNVAMKKVNDDDSLGDTVCEKDVTITVLPRTQTLTLPENVRVVVDGDDHTSRIVNHKMDVTVADLDVGAKVAVSVKNANYGETYTWSGVDDAETSKDGKTYTFTVKNADAKVTLATTPYTYSVNDFDVKKMPADCEYDGEVHAAEIAPKEDRDIQDDDYRVVYVQEGGIVSEDAPKDVGKYTVNIVKIKDGETYKAGEFAITPANATKSDFDVTLPEKVVADGKAHTAEIKVKDESLFNSDKVTFKTTYWKDNVQVDEPVEIGDYTAQVEITSKDPNLNSSKLSWTYSIREKPAELYTLSVKGGTVKVNDKDAVANDGVIAVEKDAKVEVTFDKSTLSDAQVFDLWSITPDSVLNAVDPHAETIRFTMPAEKVTIEAMTRDATIESEGPGVLGTAALIGVAGAGAAVVGYQGYMIGTELYLNTVLPDGVAIPQNTAELAKLVWTEAGKPAPAAVMAPDATDEQKALTWAIENQLISADKAADASVGRWEVIQTWNKAQEMKG